MAENEKQYTPLLPYNENLFNSYIIYDNVAYIRNINLPDATVLRRHSPSMIKYFRCDSSETVLLGGD